MKILTADKDIIPFTKESKIKIEEVFFEEKLIGYNLLLDDEILDTYDSEEEAEAVSEHIFNNSDKNLNIEKINKELEIV